MRTIWDFWANKYEKLWVQKYSLTPTRNKILDIVKNECVPRLILDMGCGTGQLTRELAELYPNSKIIGIDYSREMINLAKEKIKNSNKNISYFNQNVNDFNLDEKVDVIVCTHSFPYYDNKKGVFKKFNDALNDDGILLLAQASENSFYDKICMLAVKTTTTKAKYLSIAKLQEISKDYFEVYGVERIKEKWYMPTIVVMKMRKVM